MQTLYARETEKGRPRREGVERPIIIILRAVPESE